MAMSDTPTSSLSLRLPVGVRATLSGFIVRSAKQRPPILRWNVGPTRQSYRLLSQSTRTRSRESRLQESTSPRGTCRPGGSACGACLWVRSLWSLTPAAVGDRIESGYLVSLRMTTYRPDWSGRAPKFELPDPCRSCGAALPLPGGSPPADRYGVLRSECSASRA